MNIKKKTPKVTKIHGILELSAAVGTAKSRRAKEMLRCIMFDNRAAHGGVTINDERVAKKRVLGGALVPRACSEQKIRAIDQEGRACTA